ncbi:hypothetical protein CZ787_07575 [Halomonas citrativorans]|uniref:Uncharacterized protein n=1 Tax=Halomonas citrativorans TaxID=2742612 RepID=A0A1R4HY15_9GAMM|nr:hypothetical protein CZ787_07575 [Halomonas citrativorans]
MKRQQSIVRELTKAQPSKAIDLVAMNGIHAVPDADAMKVTSGCVMIAV